MSKQSTSPYSKFTPVPESRDSTTLSKTSNHNNANGYVEYIGVCAIDIGSVYSVYAYSLDSNPESIHIARQENSRNCQQTLTCILLDPNGEFMAFGDEARTQFLSMPRVESRKCLFFDKFKMQLNEVKEVNETTMIEASNGTQHSALMVFAKTLHYIKEALLNEINKVIINATSKDFKWVLTVPTLWNNEARQFLREASYQAGLTTPYNPARVVIALESEAASLYCRRMQLISKFSVATNNTTATYNTPVNNYTHSDLNSDFVKKNIVISDSPNTYPDDVLTASVTSSRPMVFNQLNLPSDNMSIFDERVSKYVLVDCGGGTVDITVHEIDLEDGSLKELHTGCGGPFGGAHVNMSFCLMLQNSLGPAFVKSVLEKNYASWFYFIDQFEVSKRKVGLELDEPLSIPVPYKIVAAHKKYIKILNKKQRRVPWNEHGIFFLQPEAVKIMFDHVIDGIVRLLNYLFHKDDVKDVKHIFLVGGFANSPILQQKIRQTFFKRANVFIPQEAELCVIKGAVLYGLEPNAIKVRRTPYSYGIRQLRRFNNGKDDINKRVIINGQEYCRDAFCAFLRTDDSVTNNMLIEKVFRCVKNKCVIDIFQTKNTDATYTTEDCVTKCGTITLVMEENSKASLDNDEKNVHVSFVFEDDQLNVYARNCKDLQSETLCKTSINFYSY